MGYIQGKLVQHLLAELILYAFQKRLIKKITPMSSYIMDAIYMLNHLFPNFVDLDEQKLYWINHTGKMKSANVNGSDVKTILDIFTMS